MGWWSDLTGATAAEAAQKAGETSRSAAADTYGKQQDAIRKLLGYGDKYATDTRALSSAYDPYVRTGTDASLALRNLIADPSSVRNLPGYQFDQAEGIQALDRSAQARGRLDSGRQSKDLMRFGTGLADKTYGDQLARLMGLQGQGMQATGTQTGVIGQGLTGQLGARTSSYGGDMTSAGTIGQGDVAGASADLAGANARTTGMQNLFNTGANLAGNLFGGGSGIRSLFGGGSGMSNYGQTSNATGYGAGTGGLSFPMFR